MNYKESYYMLFNTITDAINQLEITKEFLIKSQQETETIYIKSENKNILNIQSKNKED